MSPILVYVAMSAIFLGLSYWLIVGDQTDGE